MIFAAGNSRTYGTKVSISGNSIYRYAKVASKGKLALQALLPAGIGRVAGDGQACASRTIN